MTAQEVSTMVKNNLDVVIFLMNNGSYGIEATLHDGPYNVLQSWNYAKLMKIFAKTNPNAQGFRAKTHDELLTAMDYAKNNKGPMLIECCIQLDDCSHKLLSWGALMARADMGTVAM
jgi:indolepyruvate decarboxylase